MGVKIYMIERLASVYYKDEPTFWMRVVYEATGNDYDKALSYYTFELEKLPPTKENVKAMEMLIKKEAPAWITRRLSPNRLQNIAILYEEGFKNARLLDSYNETLEKEPRKIRELFRMIRAITSDDVISMGLLSAWVDSKKEFLETYQGVKDYFGEDKGKLLNWLRTHGPHVDIEGLKKKIRHVGKEFIFNSQLLYEFSEEDLKNALKFIASHFPSYDDKKKVELALTSSAKKLARSNPTYLSVWNDLPNIAHNYNLDLYKLREAFILAAHNKASYINLLPYTERAINGLAKKAMLLDGEGVLEDVAYSGGFFYLPYNEMRYIIKRIKEDPLIGDKKKAIVEHIRDGIGMYIDAPGRVIGERYKKKFEEHLAEVNRQKLLKNLQR